jgi:hypothetical protein
MESQQVRAFGQIGNRLLPPPRDMVERITFQRQSVVSGEPPQSSPLRVEDLHAYAAGCGIGIDDNRSA